MTVTADVTPAAPDLRDLTLDELNDLYYGTDDPITWAAIKRDMDRRDREDKLAKARAKLAEIHAEGYDAAHAQYLKASEYTRGKLLSDYGRTRVTDEMSLWTGSEADAMRNSSEELRDFWLYEEPRITPGRYARQRGRQERIGREEARDNREATHEHIHRDHADGGRERAEVAGLQAGALRPGQAPPQAPQAGTRGPVLSSRRGGTGSEASQDGAGDGRPSRPVQRDSRMSGCRHPHRVGTPAQCSDCPVKTAGTVAVPAAGTVTARPDEPRIPGDQLLDLLRDAWFGYFARFPSPAALDAVTLWAAHTHMRDEKGILVFRATPRLGLLSSEPGSGKGLVLELLMDVVPNCYGLDLEPTQAGLVHTLNSEHATVCIDESDILFGAGSRKEGVRAVLNGGTYRYGTILNGKGGKTNRVPVFGPVALAGLDVMEKDTGDKLTALFTRFVKIYMVKVTGDEKPPKRTAQSYDAAAKAKVWLERWAAQVRDEVAAAEPEFPEGLEGRTEDIWGPLLSVADAAGGTWPDRARGACRELALGKPDGGEDLEGEFAAFAESFGTVGGSW